MSRLEKETSYIKESLSQLQAFLLSAELFWPLGGNHLRLTPGGLLLSIKFAKAVAKTPVEQASGERLFRQFEMQRTKWLSAWQKKAKRELRMRIDLWQSYLADYRIAPEQQADSYRNEVRLRVLSALLLEEIPEAPKEALTLPTLDARLQEYFLPGEFLWEDFFRSEFSPENFWYLYGKLRP